MEILLVRHGMTAGNREGRYIGQTDEPLLPEACENLRQSPYRDFHPEMVYVSPMLRCRQTAEILFADTGCDVKPLGNSGCSEAVGTGFCGGSSDRFVVNENLREMDFGEFENKNYEDLRNEPVYQEWIDAGGTFAFPGGEDPGVFRKRCRKAFEDCVADAGRRDAGRIALVVHGGTIMSIMEEYGFPKGDFYRWQVRNGEGILLSF